MSPAPRSSSYEIVVVGSGLAGICAGALLANAQRRVLVVEQAPSPGGYAHAFTRGPYTFDPAVHSFPEGGPGGLPDGLLRHLGVRDKCTMIKTESLYRVRMPDLDVEVPCDIDACIELHQRLYPDEANGIERFLRLCRQIHLEAHALPPQLGLQNLDEAANRFPTLFRYLRATVQDVLDEHVANKEAQALLGVSWPWLGVPPSRLSFVTFATVLSVGLAGTYYAQGTFQRLVDAFVSSLRRDGGELILGNGVKRIKVTRGRVSGVELEDGSAVEAEAVISNADALTTFEQLVGAEHFPDNFMSRQRRMVPSLSAVVVFIATKLDMRAAGAAHELFTPRSLDHDRCYAEALAARPGGQWACAATLTDPSLAPADEHTMTIMSLAPYAFDGSWTEAGERFGQDVLEQYGGLFPGLLDRLTHYEVATPLALAHWTRNSGGSAYGWENVPAQTGGRRSPHVPPVEGLFLAGHWTQPGSCSLRVLVSGLHAAEVTLRSRWGQGLDFEHRDKPPAS